MLPGQTSAATVLITKADIKDIAAQAIRLPTTTGDYTARVLEAFFVHVKNVYGIDLQMETEEMRDEQLKREAKELRKRDKQRSKLGSRKSRARTDDF